MFLKRICWLLVGIVLVIIFLILLFKDLYGLELPKEPTLYFLSENSTLWIIQKDQIEKKEITQVDKEYLFTALKRPSRLKIVGDYIGLAGGAIITAGEIASLTLPPFAPFIQIITRTLGGSLALLGGIFRFTSKDLSVKLLPARLILFSDTESTILIQNIPEIIILAYAPFSLIQKEVFETDGYLLVYNKRVFVGKLKPKRIQISQENSFWLEVVTIGGLGIYLPKLNSQYEKVIVLERRK